MHTRVIYTESKLNPWIAFTHGSSVRFFFLWRLCHYIIVRGYFVRLPEGEAFCWFWKQQFISYKISDSVCWCHCHKLTYQFHYCVYNLHTLTVNWHLLLRPVSWSACVWIAPCSASNKSMVCVFFLNTQVLALGMMFIGLTMTIIAHWPGSTSIGENPLRIAGPILLAVGGVLFLLGVILICCLNEREKRRWERMMHKFVASRPP